MQYSIIIFFIAPPLIFLHSSSFFLVKTVCLYFCSNFVAHFLFFLDLKNATTTAFFFNNGRHRLLERWCLPVNFYKLRCMISLKLKLLKSIFVLGEKLHLVTFMRRSKLLEVSSMIFRVWLLRVITMTMLNKQRSRQEKSPWLHWFGFSFIKTKLRWKLK